MPLSAAADDTPSSDATATPAASDSTPSASPYNAAGALGPSTGAGALGPSSGSSSTGDSSALQPAGSNPMQSTNGDSTGLTAPNAQSLQGTAPSDQSLNVIKGEADGAPQSPDSGPNYWLWALLVVLFAAVVAAASWLLRRRRVPAGGPAPRRQGTAPIPAAARAKSEPTSSQRLRITIERPVPDVFEFVLDPSNTPKWLNVIQSVETSEWPAQNGTVYTNTDQDGNLSEYKLSNLKPPHAFVLNKVDSSYHVRYELSELDGHSTELEYYEWMDEGTLAQPFTSKELDKLKKVLEAKPDAVEANDADAPIEPDDTGDEFTASDVQSEPDPKPAETSQPSTENPGQNAPSRPGKKHRRHR